MSATGKAARIYDALVAKVATLGGGLPVSYPEATPTFAPPANGKYLAVSYFPNRPAWEGVSAGRIDQGLLQISVVWPKNAGLVAPLDIAETIIAHFALGTVMVSGTVKVKVSRQPWAAAPLSEADKVMVPVSIPWSA